MCFNVLNNPIRIVILCCLYQQQKRMYYNIKPHIFTAKPQFCSAKVKLCCIYTHHVCGLLCTRILFFSPPLRPHNSTLDASFNYYIRPLGRTRARCPPAYIESNIASPFRTRQYSNLRVIRPHSGCNRGKYID